MPTAASEFERRMEHLSREVGYGSLEAKCEVDQAYAQNQHQSRHFRHDDGMAGFLGDPLLENQYKLCLGLAHRTITREGSDLVGGMIDVAEEMAGYVLKLAPKETNLLSLSAHPTVMDGTRLVYDRPPIAPRASE